MVRKLFILKTRSGKYYTGKAGEGWLSPKVDDAFTYESPDYACKLADRFNSRQGMHGEYFLTTFIWGQS